MDAAGGKRHGRATDVCAKGRGAWVKVVPLHRLANPASMSRRSKKDCESKCCNCVQGQPSRLRHVQLCSSATPERLQDAAAATLNARPAMSDRTSHLVFARAPIRLKHPGLMAKSELLGRVTPRDGNKRKYNQKIECLCMPPAYTGVAVAVRNAPRKVLVMHFGITSDPG